MKKIYIIVFTSMFIHSCEDKKDTIPPVVSISTPTSGSIVNEVVTITCHSTDNERVEKVELWVDCRSSKQLDYFHLIQS